MSIARALMICSEILVALALLMRILLPSNFDVSFRLSPEITIGIPIRWLVPLMLISGAGVLSTFALLRLFWTLAHHA